MLVATIVVPLLLPASPIVAGWSVGGIQFAVLNGVEIVDIVRNAKMDSVLTPMIGIGTTLVPAVGSVV